MIGALLLAVSTYPPLLPRGVLVQVVESAVLWSLGARLGRGRAPLGPVGVVVTAAWVAVEAPGLGPRAGTPWSSA